MGFLEVLTLLFILLKIVGVITWPWLWVVAPELFAVACYIALLLFFGTAFIAVIGTLAGHKKKSSLN